jgi:hypothetical protein
LLKCYLIAPAINGNVAKAKFCNISINPNAVPNNRDSTIIGTDGTIAVQNKAQHIPKLFILLPKSASGTAIKYF